MDSRMPKPRHIVIIGGGVIGTTTAYYLTRHPTYNTAIHHITLLEASSIAAAASGKAGGLLGLWAYPTCLVPLSYRLHAELAAEHNGAERWGYRHLECGQLTASVRDKVARESPKAKRKRKSSLGIAKQQEEENEQTPKSDDSAQVEWQKLPKQDENARSLLHNSVLPEDLDWINGSLVREYAEMGLPGFTSTAQVHPYQFTTWMAALARQGGTEIRVNAYVTSIGLNKSNTSVDSITFLDRLTSETTTLSGVTDVILAAGPWTGKLWPKSKVSGLRAHSVVFAADVSPYAVFTNIRLPADWLPAHRVARGETRRRHRGNVDPEMYARPGGEVYACGEPDAAAALPETADLVLCDDAQCEDLVAYIASVSPVLGAAEVVAKQACYIPRHIRFGKESPPLVGRTSVDGLWVAAGHTCWGIQNGPATGKLMSEFVFDGEARSADVAELDPGRYKV
ncbi:FAD dependent oxidoreductase [Annulohypoxylon maeteangense]|uniref:FAD dependent oxidoreductase n=1 Tax=Annulohypoxylon maeteangense TaxID=1927788 RepID=UPI0020081BB5|nr:FAD dependent oxidoreductase [Annulohypoxylon maeteangense]KAI0885169.1 FAD dependent oxidoreductase [Annulohypoxylon maeteangense]